MAATHSIVDKVSLGGTDWLYIGFTTLDASYPTGGESIDLTGAVGIAGPAKLKSFMPGFPVAGVAFPKWDAANQKLLMVSAVAGTEVANTTDLSASVIPFWAIGPGGA